MIPRVIVRRLRQLRRRERMLRLIWGVARLAAVMALVILGGCLIDWLCDRFQDTPNQVRVLLLCVTSFVTLLAFLFWVFLPVFERQPMDDLALRAEGKYPAFRNRLISAVQLNRPGADTEGMSVELIGVMTKEAVARAEAISFHRVADHSRLGRAFIIVFPVAA